MYTLFFDTHGSEIIVSLYDGENSIEKRRMSEFSHAKFLAPMVEELIRENNVSFSDIKNIVAVNGPGSFTGLRIGLSFAKTMAYSLNIPIYLISTLKAILVSDDKDDDRIAVITDNKGYYISVNESDEDYVEDISEYKNYRVVDEVIDVKKVVDYALKGKDVNAHLVRANYVKKIEVEK